ncbi:hypothetical protein MVEN_00666200 [Mycena venus]|uniref:Uncharacterized protein n=1 Tax=Mycena venus TaxID=2733690 RepID=A0A8H6YQ65_9AGAR|nr:hypothetical protein MVEN_00666200 [Mycena venus]
MLTQRGQDFVAVQCLSDPGCRLIEYTLRYFSRCPEASFSAAQLRLTSQTCLGTGGLRRNGRRPVHLFDAALGSVLS